MKLSEDPAALAAFRNEVTTLGVKYAVDRFERHWTIGIDDVPAEAWKEVDHYENLKATNPVTAARYADARGWLELGTTSPVALRKRLSGDK